MIDQPDLFSIIDDDDVMTYNGTTGAVHQPASQERAQREAKSGESRQRATRILELLEHQSNGLTWQQLGALMNLHHGQMSGALSNLHKSGHVFMLREQRNRCHPYVHSSLRHLFPAEERIDQPAQTKAGQRKNDLERLLELVIDGIRVGTIHDGAVIHLVNQLRSDT